MSKNIVLCCDGTSNEFSGDKTNVVKLYQVLAQANAQLTYYHPGVGTMEAVGAVTSIARKATKWLGLAIGYGLEDDIRDAYVFLMRHYEPGDRIFLFGFSRGAYTVRALASLLHMYGLITRGNEPLARYAIRMLLASGKRSRGNKNTDPSPAKKSKAPENAFSEAREFKRAFAQPCPIHFVGVWDTVSSIGWFFNPRSLPFTSNNPEIAAGRHAVAIDERRGFFRQNLWRPSDKEPFGPKDLKQVWFSGGHGDVGGGYPESQSGLSNHVLHWMLREARQRQLDIDETRLAALQPRLTPNPGMEPHHSLTMKWWFPEIVPKRHARFTNGEWRDGWRINFFRRRTVPEGATIHESALARGNAYTKPWLPKAYNVEKDPPATAAA